MQAQAQQVVQRFQEVHGADCAFSEQEQWVLASSDFVSDALLAQPAGWRRCANSRRRPASGNTMPPGCRTSWKRCAMRRS
ncbi:hypothetical protein J4732_18270 [Serratia marcescens]|uniref:Uncharacterized protein n=1 Tax=Serratia marcescens TaxID=615 RepID=A0A939NLI9_SERMA|nr:hypothetical protein [Serratia marcescens]